jgi:hypothetical protein
VASAVAARIGAEVLAPPGDLRAARRAFRGARLVIALRAPAVAAAAAAAVPVLGVTANPAVAGLARRLGQPAIPAAAMNRPWQFAGAVLAALDTPPAPLPLLKGQVLAADESLRLLRLLLTGGRDDHPLPHRGLTLEPAPWLC